MKLELKHLTPYLPYRLKIQGQTHGDIQTMKAVYDGGVYTEEQCSIGLSQYGAWADIFEIKPILRPLSDLTKEIEINGKKFVPMDALGDTGTWLTGVGYNVGAGARISIRDYERLHEWHFDMRGLIENNLAIDINTIK